MSISKPIPTVAPKRLKFPVDPIARVGRKLTQSGEHPLINVTLFMWAMLILFSEVFRGAPSPGLLGAYIITLVAYVFLCYTAKSRGELPYDEKEGT